MPFDIQIQKVKYPKPKPDTNNLGFGRYFTDHMFMMDYSPEKGWYDPKIIPYQSLEFAPSTSFFHYGQVSFEGLKAYKTKSRKILLFRPVDNIKRMNYSNDRLAIPELDESLIMEAVKTLVNLDKDWIPEASGTSLYIRPFAFATDPFLGVKPSDTYKFIIILSPVGSYYSEGMNPIKVYVETTFSRAAKGGMGNVKTPGNYAATLKTQTEAKKKGCSQVLWLDACSKKYIEEIGSMNVFFKINGEVITPDLNGSILDGITRKSVIQLIKSWNIPCSEKKISIDEIKKAYNDNTLEEAFGTGTAAVISSIGEFLLTDQSIQVNQGKYGELTSKIYNTMTGIQTGVLQDNFNWVVEI